MPYFCEMMIPSIVWTICFGIFCLVITIQVFYYLYFFSRLASYETVTSKTPSKNPISVIICARDEAHNLVKNLPGILVQDYATPHEILVVNDNSTDETKYIIDEFKRSFDNLTLVDLTQEAKMISGKKFPLSMGIKSAKHDIVLLTDADCIPASEFWIQKMQEKFKGNIEIVLGYGAYRKRFGVLNLLIRFETFHTALQYLSYALAGIPYMGVGRNLSYRKEVFIRNKGFSAINKIPSGDDDLFINKVANKRNTAICIDPDTFTISEHKKTWNDWMTQKYRHYTTGKYYKPIHKFLLGLYSLTLFLVYPMFLISLFFFNWWMSIGIYLVRLSIQAVIYLKAMRKLNEADLFPWFILLDIWMFIYYIITLPAIWKAPRKSWN